MNKLDKQYQELLKEILEKGAQKEDRTGTGTLSVFGKQIRHDMSEGFPLLTTKKIAVKTMMTELKWFLKRDTNIKYLVDNNCHIWNGDAYKAYLNRESTPGIPPTALKLHQSRDHILSPNEFTEKIKSNDEFAKKYGDIGPIYGRQWRGWNGFGGSIDQIYNLIKGLKENPDSRRHLVSAWNVSDLKYMVLPPCHYSFQCYVADGKLSLIWNQRSADLFLGVPFNIASYGTLLLLLCEETGLEAGELIGNLGDTHLYKNHLNQAAEQILRSSYKLPTIKLSNVDILNGEWKYEVEEYEYHPIIKAPLSN